MRIRKHLRKWISLVGMVIMLMYWVMVPLRQFTRHLITKMVLKLHGTRDLNCSNIFVEGNSGILKIGDLGLSYVLGQDGFAHSVVGTPNFMALELYEENYDELVDIYSFGMCIMEMVTIEIPYNECSSVAQVYKKATSGRMPAALGKVLDPQVRQLIDKCLAPRMVRLSIAELMMDPVFNQVHMV
ncbi:hypothetical protein SUGI_0961580 [Cryptomeria japonica]|nr:hypothetical protein SUGI_0961580 [Cryptomeria japonica]